MTYACHVPQRGPRQGWEDKCRPRSQCALAGGQTDNAALDHNFELKHQLILVYHGSYGLRSRPWTVNSGWSHPAEGNAKCEASKHSENSHISRIGFQVGRWFETSNGLPFWIEQQLTADSGQLQEGHAAFKFMMPARPLSCSDGACEKKTLIADCIAFSLQTAKFTFSSLKSYVSICEFPCVTLHSVSSLPTAYV